VIDLTHFAVDWQISTNDLAAKGLPNRLMTKADAQ
jgi:hypothetical protein